MTSTTWLLGASIIPLGYLCISFLFPSKPRKALQDALPSALIPSYTSHARLLPTPTKHAFSYPLIYLGVDIDALESGNLDLACRFFSYGGSPWSKWLGLRSYNYLTPGSSTLREKLDALLKSHGMGGDQMTKAWMVSMPSFMGFEGINPLTVWYIYNAERELSCIILEVHNTFGEKHAYVLRVDSEYLVKPNEGYDKAWIFPRTFHVSPFNSRNGFYRLDILDPFPSNRAHLAPSPRMKVFLRLLTPEKQTKLTAVVASHPCHPPIPLERSHIPLLLFALVRWPLTLFMSTPRILYHAYILHYLKKLAMYPRPEPRAEGQKGVWNPPENYVDRVGSAIGWQGISTSEGWLRDVVENWAVERAKEIGVGFKVDFRDTRLKPILVGSETERLCISTSDPCFFTNLVLAPTPQHYLALAPELTTDISDPALFADFFAIQTTTPEHIDRIDNLLSNIRTRFFRWYISHSTLSCPPHLYIYPSSHFTSTFNRKDRFWLVYHLYMAFFASWAEERVMRIVSAKFVDGGAPWEIWQRALRRLYNEAEPEEDWTIIGSIQY